MAIGRNLSAEPPGQSLPESGIGVGSVSGTDEPARIDKTVGAVSLYRD